MSQIPTFMVCVATFTLLYTSILHVAKLFLHHWKDGVKCIILHLLKVQFGHFLAKLWSFKNIPDLAKFENTDIQH